VPDGRVVVTSDMYGTSSTMFWGSGVDVSENVKNWTGAHVKQHVPYKPTNVSLNFDRRWKRNVAPAGVIVGLPMCYDINEIVEVIPNTSGMLCMWGTMSDGFVPPSAGFFRLIGDLFLDVTLEFKDLGAELKSQDLQFASPTAIAMTRTEQMIEKVLKQKFAALGFDNNPDAKLVPVRMALNDKDGKFVESNSKIVGVPLSVDQLDRFRERKLRTPSRDDDYVSDIDEPGLRPTGDVYYVGTKVKSNSNKSTKSVSSKAPE